MWHVAAATPIFQQSGWRKISFFRFIQSFLLKADHLVLSVYNQGQIPFQEKAAIVTGDPEFKKVKDLVEIDWL